MAHHWLNQKGKGDYARNQDAISDIIIEEDLFVYVMEWT